MLSSRAKIFGNRLKDLTKLQTVKRWELFETRCIARNHSRQVAQLSQRDRATP